MIWCPGLRSLKATWFINVCAGECNRYIITGDALLKGLLLGGDVEGDRCAGRWELAGGVGGQDVVRDGGRLWVWVGV